MFCCLLWFIPVALLLTIEFIGRNNAYTMVLSFIQHPAHFLPGVGVGVEAENLVRIYPAIIIVSTTCNTIQMTKCRISFNEDAAHLS